MATSMRNLSQYDAGSLPDVQGMRFGIVVAQWNKQVTEALYQGAYQTLRELGVAAEDIIRLDVPGSFELPFGAKRLLSATDVDAVIVIGCVIRGQTPHFEYVSQGVTMGITQLNVQWDRPVIFGVLTTDNLEQAMDRAGGKYGNKGVEAGIAAIQMAAIARKTKF